MTLILTDDVNGVMQSVNDIVHLPKLDPEELIHRVRQGQIRSREIIEQLYQLDQSLVSAVKSLKQNMDTMKNYVADMDKMIQSENFSIGNFSKLRLYESDAYVEMAGGNSIVQGLVKNYLNIQGRLQNKDTPVDQVRHNLENDTEPDFPYKSPKIT